MVQVPNFKASADINRSRFVAISGANTVAQAGVGSAPIGVSQRGTYDTPLPSASTLAAPSGKPVSVFGPGEMCIIEAGAAISAGGFLKPGTDGVAMPIVGGEAYYAQALHAAAASGEMVDAYLIRGVIPTPTVTIVATGSTAANGTALIGNTVHIVGDADGTKGVVLPAAVEGMRIEVYNTHATNGLKIWPATGDDINDGTTDAAVTIEGKTTAVLVALDATTWRAVFTANT